MTGHDTVNVIYWFVGVAIVALIALWIALSVAHQREHRQRVARYDAARRGHWEQVKAAFPDCAGELPPELDEYVVDDPKKPQREGGPR